MVQLLVVRAFERELAAEERVEKHAEGPDVRRGTRIFDLSDDFRSHIRWSPTEKLDLFVMGDACRKAEIYQLDSLLRLVQQDIFQLDIPMSYIALVAIVNRLDDLAPEKFCLELWHLSIRFHFEITVQTASIDEFHDEENLLRRLKYLEKLCNMLMVKLLHDFHFTFDTFPPVRLH